MPDTTKNPFPQEEVNEVIEKGLSEDEQRELDEILSGSS